MHDAPILSFLNVHVPKHELDSIVVDQMKNETKIQTTDAGQTAVVVVLVPTSSYTYVYPGNNYVFPNTRVRVPIPITQVCSYNDRSMQSSFVISYKIIKAAIKPNGDSD